MKRYAFFYHDSLETDMPRDSYKDHLVVLEHSFPKGVTDWEILEAARKEECKEKGLGETPFGFNAYFTRKLIRVVELARDLSLPPAE